MIQILQAISAGAGLFHQQIPLSINLLLYQIDIRIRQVLKAPLACNVFVDISRAFAIEGIANTALYFVQREYIGLNSKPCDFNRHF